MRHSRVPLVAVLAVLLAGSAGCATGAPSSTLTLSATPSADVAATSTVATAAPVGDQASASPASTRTPGGTTHPTPGVPSPDLTLTPPGGGLPEPPPALLIAPGDVTTPGELGSFVWQGGGQDAPWLPARILPVVSVRTGDVLGLSSTIAFSSATVVIAPAADESGRDARPWVRLRGASAQSPVVLDVPPPGSWVMVAHLDYGEFASGTWYWNVRTE